LAGWSLQSVAKDLNGRGVPTLRGKRWGATTVRRMISKPTVAGRRDVDIEGTWEPILDLDTWRRVRSLLDGRVITKARARRRFLFTGIAVCGRCGGRMGAQQKKGSARSTTTARYFCRPLEGQCQKVSISADEFEAQVVATLLDELDKPGFLAVFAADEHEVTRKRLTDDLSGVAERRAELARERAAGDIDADEWREMRAVLDADQQRLSLALAEIPSPVDGIDPQVIREGWDAMTLDERRQVVEMFIESVTIRPATRHGLRRYDDERFQPESDLVWRMTP
jgi:hypothetical protein